MPSAPTFVIDGTHGYGTQVVTINGTQFILDDFRVNRAVEKAQQRTAAGAPQKQRFTAGFDAGTATCQIGSGTSGYPKFGDTFTVTVDDNYGAEIWVLNPVNIDQNNEATAIRKLPISFDKVYNGSVTAS